MAMMKTFSLRRASPDWVFTLPSRLAGVEVGSVVVAGTAGLGSVAFGAGKVWPIATKESSEKRDSADGALVTSWKSFYSIPWELKSQLPGCFGLS